MKALLQRLLGEKKELLARTGSFAGIIVALASLLGWGQAWAAGEVAGLVQQKISVDGADRSYLYFVSSKCNSFNGQWVVFALHDTGQSAEQFAVQSGWMKVAEDRGFAVVFPQAIGNAWISASGANDAYLKAVFDHARTHLISRYPGDRLPPAGGLPAGDGSNNPIWAWEPLRDLTGVGAGATVAQDFAINHPGLFAAVATMNGVAFDAAYRRGDEPAQNYFQHMRGKNVEPVWKQLKRQVPETVWMFTSDAGTAGEDKQAAYWKRSASVAPAGAAKTIDGFETTVFASAANPAQQLRVTKLAPGAKYDEAMSAAIWDDLFCHLARWTSSPNGDLNLVQTEAEVDRDFEVRSITVPGAEPYKYYLKLPSSHKKGQTLPLVISTHGANEQAWLFSSKIRMHELGEKEGFITVYPSGHMNRWASNVPDGPDSKFLEAMIRDLVSNYEADPTRVYMQGFSNGSIMTEMMAVTHPELFAAMSPNNGPGPLQGAVKAYADKVKEARDIRIPVMAVYGSVDSGASVDGLILASDGSALPTNGPSSMGAQGGIETLKEFNHIATADRVETFRSAYAYPYKIDVLQGTHKQLAVDSRYPAGRFQMYEYRSADPMPLNLLDVVWVMDLPHAYDFREAKMEWEYFRHWRRNPDGSLTYGAK